MQGVQPRPKRKPSSGAAASPTAGTGGCASHAGRTAPARRRPGRAGSSRSPSTISSWCRQVDQPGADRPRHPTQQHVDDREAEHEEHRAGQHPAAPRVLEVGAGEPGRVGEVARAAAGSRTARRTRPARRPAPPGWRAPASRTRPAAGTSQPLVAATSCDDLDQGRADGHLADDAGRDAALAVEDDGRGDRVGCEHTAEGEQRLAPGGVERRPGDAEAGLVGLGLRRCHASRMSMPTKWAVSPSCFAARRPGTAPRPGSRCTRSPRR